MRCHPRHITRRGSMCARPLPGGGSRRRRVGEPACMKDLYLAISRVLCHSRTSSLSRFATAPSRREPLVREATDGERRGASRQRSDRRGAERGSPVRRVHQFDKLQFDKIFRLGRSFFSLIRPQKCPNCKGMMLKT